MSAKSYEFKIYRFWAFHFDPLKIKYYIMVVNKSEYLIFGYQH
jgi:hypothetical protein